MEKYYQLVAYKDGYAHIIFGSYVRSEVEFERKAELHNLKQDGFEKVQIESSLIISQA